MHILHRSRYPGSKSAAKATTPALQQLKPAEIEVLPYQCINNNKLLMISLFSQFDWRFGEQICPQITPHLPIAHLQPQHHHYRCADDWASWHRVPEGLLCIESHRKIMNMEKRKKIWRITIENMLKEHGKDKGFRDRNQNVSFDCKLLRESLLTTLPCMPCAHYHDSIKIHLLEELSGGHRQPHLLSSSPHLRESCRYTRDCLFSHKHSRQP